MNPQFVIFIGEDKTMNLDARIPGSKRNLDLSLCSEIVVALPLSDGGYSRRLFSKAQVFISSPATEGKFTVPIDRILSASLQSGKCQDLDVAFTILGVEFNVSLENALTIIEMR